jgi:hypothetical protein
MVRVNCLIELIFAPYMVRGNSPRDLSRFIIDKVKNCAYGTRVLFLIRVLCFVSNCFISDPNTFFCF